MQQVAEDVIRADDFAFIDRIWADWSPGYDASEDLPKVKDCIRQPEHFQAALGYYWGQFDPTPVRLPGMGRRAGRGLGQGRYRAHLVPARHSGRLPRHDPGTSR
jgi:hypothetical protein